MKTKCLVFSLFLFVSFHLSLSQNLDSMLLLYYPFNGNTNDASGNGYHGTAYNASLADDRFGNPNNAYYLNGTNSYIDFPNIAALKPPLPVTVSMWVKPMSLDLTHQGYVFNSSFDTDTYTGVMLNLYPGQPIVSTGYGGGIPGVTGPNNRRTKFGTTNFQTNTWYFIAVVIRGPTDMDIYVNCQNDGGYYDGTGGPLVYGSGPGTIGRSDLHFTSTVFFHGYVDDVSYWERALSPSEIELLCSLNADAGDDQTICQGNSVTIGGSPTAIYGSPPYTYTWSPTSGLNNPNISNPIATPLNTTTYKLLVEDSFSIIAIDSVTITVLPTPLIDLGPDTTFCETDSLILNAGGGFQSYIWSNGSSDQFLQVFTNGTYSVTVSDNYGCTASDEITASIVTQFDATIIGADNPFCNTIPVVHLYAVTNGGVWSGLGIIDNNSGQFSPELVGVGEYLITYEIFGPCGNYDTTTIKVIDCNVVDPHIWIPNIFSPNGDNENDILFVRGKDIQFIEFYIYNRWGQKVFESNDINTGWDGTFKNKICDPGVYTYLVIVKLQNCIEIKRSGTITLVY